MKKCNTDNRDRVQGGAAPAAKRPWTVPGLKAYGSIRTLTTGLGSAHPGDGGARKFRPCDRRLKENIVRVGEHPLGVGLYLFEYKPEYHRTLGAERRLGVMADEIETVLPEAVSVCEDGFKRVDYTVIARAAGVH